MVDELGDSHLASQRLRAARVTEQASTTAELMSSESSSKEEGQSSVGRNSQLATAISAPISEKAVTTAISGVDLAELIPLVTAISNSAIFDDTQVTSASSSMSFSEELHLYTARSPDVETAVEV